MSNPRAGPGSFTLYLHLRWRPPGFQQHQDTGAQRAYIVLHGPSGTSEKSFHFHDGKPSLSPIFSEPSTPTEHLTPDDGCKDPNGPDWGLTWIDPITNHLAGPHELPGHPLLALESFSLDKKGLLDSKQMLSTQTEDTEYIKNSTRARSPKDLTKRDFPVLIYIEAVDD